jgi:starch phosphorylase
MKVIANGGLNFSILDGWWDEGFDAEVGWKIGNGEEYADHDYQDEVEARQLYHLLETQIVPLFYLRGEDLLPRGWINKVKNSMKKLGPFFNTHRMVQEYFEKFYIQSYEKRKKLQQEKWIKVVELAEWKEKIRQKWTNVKVNKILDGKISRSIYVGEEYPVNAEISLGELTPDDVEVQLYFGPVEKQDDPEFNSTVVMSPSEVKDGVVDYRGKIVSKHSGQQGYTIRIVPKNPLLISLFEVGVVYWAG